MKFKLSSINWRRVTSIGIALTMTVLQPMQFVMAARVGVLLAHGIQDDGFGMRRLAQAVKDQTGTPLKVNSYSWNKKYLVDQAHEVRSVLTDKTPTTSALDGSYEKKHVDDWSKIETGKRGRSLPGSPSEFTSNKDWLYSNEEVDKVLLAGHSQGGLRLRQYLQQVATPQEQARIGGLITFGTPHKGAAIANNGNGVVSSITLGVLAPLSAISLGTTIVGYIPALGWVNQQVQEFGGAAFDEMKMGSNFIKRLNNTPITQCGWQSSRSYVQGWLWWSGYWVTTWYYTCRDVPNPEFKPIPNQVLLKAVIGGDNEINNMASDLGTNLEVARGGIGVIAGIAAVFFTGLGFTMWWNAWWALPLAGVLYNVVMIVVDLSNIWKRAVGNPAGDGFMTEDSQNFISLNVGGTKGETQRVPSAHHAGNTNGEINVSQTSQMVIATQRDLAGQ